MNAVLWFAPRQSHEVEEGGICLWCLCWLCAGLPTSSHFFPLLMKSQLCSRIGWLKEDGSNSRGWITTSLRLALFPLLVIGSGQERSGGMWPCSGQWDVKESLLENFGKYFHSEENRGTWSEFILSFLSLYVMVDDVMFGTMAAILWPRGSQKRNQENAEKLT